MAPPESHTLPQPAPLPISEFQPRLRTAVHQPVERRAPGEVLHGTIGPVQGFDVAGDIEADRKSTRLNSSHQIISYAVFCLKKKRESMISQARAPASHPTVR